MKDSAYLILYPTTSTLANWTISLRSASGHDQPTVSPTPDPATQSQFVFLGATTDPLSNVTTVQVLRPLLLPATQTLFPASNAAYANLSRAEGQRIIWAYSTRSVQDPERTDAKLEQHDDGAFGTAVVDLSRPFSAVPEGVAYTSFDTVVFIHGQST